MRLVDAAVAQYVARVAGLAADYVVVPRDEYEAMRRELRRLRAARRRLAAAHLETALAPRRSR